jgi:phosphatidylglycerophosphate synthase
MIRVQPQASRKHGGSEETDRRPLRLRQLDFWLPLALFLVRRGVSANDVSALGLIAGLASGAALAMTAQVNAEMQRQTFWLLAIAFILLRGLCNILDGVIAVEARQRTVTGGLWNEVPDRITDAATLIGAGYALGSYPSLGWAAALSATLVSYLRVQCRLLGARMDYCGPMAKPTRMTVIALAALWMAMVPTPVLGTGEFGAMALALAIVAIGGALTFVRRLRRAIRNLTLP